jgi:catechol 2,3-dioxygenase-like lactoylglutathione lyase family enzyme
MSPHVVTSLGVSDIDRAKQFYAEGLGWAIAQDHGRFVAFRIGDHGPPGLALYTGDALAYDAGPRGRGLPRRHPFAHRRHPRAPRRGAGASGAHRGEILKPAHKADWGGYLGYFTDPDGNLWKAVKGQ